jgi:hypothetical protein
MIHLTTYAGVPPQIDATLRRVVEVLPEFVVIKHKLPIHVVPAMFWLNDQNEKILGSFLWTAKAVYIHVAGIPHDGHDPLDTLCHEVAHYEQRRDRRKVVEHGREVRGRNIKKLCLEAIANGEG